MQEGENNPFSIEANQIFLQRFGLVRKVCLTFRFQSSSGERALSRKELFSQNFYLLMSSIKCKLLIVQTRSVWFYKPRSYSRTKHDLVCQRVDA